MTRWNQPTVTDMDDVLVNISIPWMISASHDAELGRGELPALRRRPGALEAAVMARRQPYVQDWLEEEHAVPPSLREVGESIYRDDARFYDELPPTRMALALLGALAQGAIPKLVVVTHAFDLGDAVNASKRRWLDRHMPGAEVHIVDSSEKKGDVIRRVAPDAYGFLDDSLKNVWDVVAVTDVVEVMIPKMGHNFPTNELEKADFTRARLSRGVTIRHYENVL